MVQQLADRQTAISYLKKANNSATLIAKQF